MIKAGDASPSQPPGHGSTMEEEAVDDATVVGGEIKVLGAWASPFVLRVRVALHLKGLDYEYVEEDVNSKSDLLLASNPVHEKVPVLLHGGRPVCESLVIVEYLDDAFPDGAGRPCFLPADPHDRAVARFWAAYIDDQLLSSWVAIHAATTEAEKAGAVARTLAAVDALEGALAESGWFGGDGVGFVDIALCGLVPAIRASEPATGLRVVDPARNPRLAAWVERFCAIDAARAAMPAVHRLVEMGKKRLAVAESTHGQISRRRPPIPLHRRTGDSRRRVSTLLHPPPRSSTARARRLEESPSVLSCANSRRPRPPPLGGATHPVPR